jgi:uncharacterized protein YbjT (DUF2867 family)
MIAVAGATGNLGKRIVKALRARGADVVALVRDPAKAKDLDARVVAIDLARPDELAAALAGATCVVSAGQGLGDVIVDAQTGLLEAAVAAGVPKLIPSDFATDFTKLPAGDNRNFDLRRAFHKRLEDAAIAPTSIFNGAFAEILTYNAPLYRVKTKTVGYWDDADHPIDFTTMDDTAAFTAAAALDPTTPAALHCASFRISARELAERSGFALERLGSLDELAAMIQRERAAHPEGEHEVFPGWQRLMYTRSMSSAPVEPLDNARYPELVWTPLERVIKA